MPTVYQEVAVEVNMEDFGDDDLIEELEERGYKVLCEGQEDEDEVIQEMIWRYKTGYIEEAMLLLERRFPGMHGISKLIKEK